MELKKKNHSGKEELRERNIVIDLKTSYKIIFSGGTVVKNLPAMQEAQETWV